MQPGDRETTMTSMVEKFFYQLTIRHRIGSSLGSHGTPVKLNYNISGRRGRLKSKPDKNGVRIAGTENAKGRRGDRTTCHKGRGA